MGERRMNSGIPTSCVEYCEVLWKWYAILFLSIELEPDV